jgi:hypothetical protein
MPLLSSAACLPCIAAPAPPQSSFLEQSDACGSYFQQAPGHKPNQKPSGPQLYVTFAVPTYAALSSKVHANMHATPCAVSKNAQLLAALQT